MDSKGAIRVTVVYRAWQLLSGLISLLFVTSFYSAEIQGYYYTFVSLLAIQTVFELGITQVITTVTSQQLANTSLHSLDAAHPPSDVTNRLSALVHVVFRRACKLVVLFIVVATALGMLIMCDETAVAPHEWLTAWVLVVLFSGIKLGITLFEGVLEGMSQVTLVSRTRLLSSLATGMSLWAGIASGGGLYAVAISTFVSTATSLLLYRSNFLPLVLRLNLHSDRASTKTVWDTKTELFQSRMAVSWISGYVIFQTLVPIAFHFLGPVEAGRIGLSLTLCSAVTAIGSAWITPRVPELSRLAKDLNLESLKVILRQMLRDVGSVNLLLVAIILAGHQIAPWVSTELVDRLPTTSTLVVLLIAALANQYITVTATFSRAFKFDPFVWPTALSACVSIILSVYLAKSMGTIGIATAYCVSLLIVLFPFSVYRHILLETGSAKFSGSGHNR